MLTKIYEQNPSERELQKVVDVLVHDGIVIYPTDSVYAFGCSLHSPKAIERLRRMKGKDAEAFSVVFGDMAQVAEYCRVDNTAFRILKRNGLPNNSDSYHCCELLLRNLHHDTFHSVYPTWQST